MADVSGLLCWLAVLVQSLAQLAGLSPAALTASQALSCMIPQAFEPTSDSQPVLLGARPIWLRQAGGDAPVCAVQLLLPGARPTHHSVCDLLLADAAGNLYGPHHSLRTVNNQSAHVYLPGACPQGLSLVAAGQVRLLESAASDPGGLAKLCGRSGGVLRRSAR